MVSLRPLKQYRPIVTDVGCPQELDSNTLLPEDAIFFGYRTKRNPSRAGMEVSLMLATSHRAMQADEGTLSLTISSCDPFEQSTC